MKDVNTSQENTWCPGCLNFVTLAMLKKALVDLSAEGRIDIDRTVLVADIGCGAKIYDYINVNAVYSLHGRVIPVAAGISAVRPDLTVIGFAGDGGTYDEGMNHLIHSAKKNVNMTMIVGDNRVFALTKGQPTSTSDEGSKKPLSPLVLAADAGATFVARTSAYHAEHMLDIIKKAIVHEGFSLVDILQPCLIFKNDADEIRGSVKILAGDDVDKNLEILRKETEKMPVGIFVDDRKIGGKSELADKKTKVANRKNRS